MRLFTLLLLLLLHLAAAAQTPTSEERKLQELGFTKISIRHKGEVVEALLLSGPEALKQKKPLLVFCQGSLPTPILAHDFLGDYPPLPFNVKQKQQQYHIAIISKPGIPIYPDTLSKELWYLPDKGQPPAKYLYNDNLYYYTRTTGAVIDHLLKQPYINKQQVVLWGHSQGARVAAHAAAKNKHVTHVVLGGTNPYSRYHQSMLQNRLASLNDPEHAQQYQQNLDSLYADYLFTLRASEKQRQEAPLLNNWYSFTEPPMLEDLLKLKQPILVTYGTADIGALDNDRLPFEFIRKGKENLTLRPYHNLEHNFFEVTPSGQPNYHKPNWDRVARDVFEWLEQQPQQSR